MIGFDSIHRQCRERNTRAIDGKTREFHIMDDLYTSRMNTNIIYITIIIMCRINIIFYLLKTLRA